jgi:hypothetical protein
MRRKIMEKQRSLRVVIIINNVLSLWSLLSITIMSYFFGYGKFPILYLFLYLILLVATILLIAKKRIGFIFTFIISILYSLLLMDEDVGKNFVFNSANFVMSWALEFPFLLFLISIPLTIIYLAEKSKNIFFYKYSSIIISLTFVIYTIVGRSNINYKGTVFVDAEIKENGKTILNCKPSSGDMRNFIVKSNSKELQKQITKYGKYYQGGYFITNATLKTNYNFNKLNSITITKINDVIVNPEITWKINEIKGETEFLMSIIKIKL